MVLDLSLITIYREPYAFVFFEFSLLGVSFSFELAPFHEPMFWKE